MEKARQYSAVISERFARMIFALKIVQLLSAISILVLAFVVPRLIFMSIILFALTSALVAVAVLIEGLAHHRFVSRSGIIDRRMQKAKFWTTAFLNAWIFLMCIAIIFVVVIVRL